LKYYDTVEESYEGDGELDMSRPDHSWLKDLKALERDYNMGLLTHESVDNFATETPELDPSQPVQSVYEHQIQESWQQQYTDQQQWQASQYTEQQPQLEYQQNQQSQVQDVYGTEQYQDQQQQYWSNQQQWGDAGVHSASIDSNMVPHQQENVQQPAQNDYWNNAHAQDIPRSQISMPGQSTGRSVFDDNQNDVKPAQQQKKESPVKHKPQPDKPAATGWFGGIWNKLSLRPKNQMKLPDDKNPTIVWDEQNKRWINLEAEGDGVVTELKPPPKMTDMFPNKQPAAPSLPPQQPAPTSLPPQPENPYQSTNMGLTSNQPVQPNLSQGDTPMMSNQNSHNTNMMANNTMQRAAPATINEEPMVQPKSLQPNMFKLQRGRNIKKSYVDVFNPGAKQPGGASTLPAPDAFSSLPANGPQINFFIPAPITDPNAPTDFLTPTPIQQLDDNSQ